jgi:hypothetical protein
MVLVTEEIVKVELIADLLLRSTGWEQVIGVEWRGAVRVKGEKEGERGEI